MTAAAAVPILIAGPTASGKSALALQIAERAGGVVINADSMQVYRELPILTAQPSVAEQARVPHRLYGHIAASDAYSVARWLADVAVELAAARKDGRRAVVVGGTGLYFKALLEGLSPIPDVDPAVRAHWRSEAATARPGDLHRALAGRDPEMAMRLDPADTQRLVRALEVFEATGRSLADWQREPGVALIDADGAVRLAVYPDRAALNARIAVRFHAMIEAGALEEVEALVSHGIDGGMPAMRALGVGRLGAHLAGRCSLAEAADGAIADTRRYAKRQLTWMRRHMMSWKSIFAQQIETKTIDELAFIYRN